MTVKKIELKVTISCEKCKVKLLTTVAKLQGIDELTVDTEKGILTVIGTVDPVCLATQIRKAKKCVDIISVGPPKKPEEKKPEEKPVDKKKLDEKPCEPLPPCCKQCRLVGVSYIVYDQDPPICSIL